MIELTVIALSRRYLGKVHAAQRTVDLYWTVRKSVCSSIVRPADVISNKICYVGHLSELPSPEGIIV